MEITWIKKEAADAQKIKQLVSEIKISPLIADLLLQRGIDSFDKAEKFFRPKLDQVHSPFAFSQMQNAVEVLSAAIVNKKKIFLFGDYDVDGTTAVAIMYNVLAKHTSNLEFYIPDRYSEGYGLGQTGVQFMIDGKADLVITLDCGIRSVDLIQTLRDHHIEVIVCDHHEPGPEVPNAILLDPKVKGETYPFSGLSGAGVGYKLLEAYYETTNGPKVDLLEQLDLLALSIAADIVPVTDENRIYAFHGLKRMNEVMRPAFKLMFQNARKTGSVKLSELVFGLAPRINAAGRIRSGRIAVSCMMDPPQTDLVYLVQEIETDNNNRKLLDTSITDQALELLKQEDVNRSSNVLYNAQWSKGVVGIVASRIIEKYPWPTIVLTESNGVLSGSARTVGGFDVHHALTQLSPLLLQFGGHQHAAGLSLAVENFDAFKNAFEQEAALYFKDFPLKSEITYDAMLPLSQLFENEPKNTIPKFMRILEGFEPFGPGNEKPVFTAQGCYASASSLLKDQHIKMKVVQADFSSSLDAIAFNRKHQFLRTAAGLSFSIAYSLDINTYKDQKNLQLVVRDIHED